MSKKTIEQKYQKLSQREHVLVRSGMYIGSIAKTNEDQWVFDVTQNKMIKKFVEFSPGFLKIFDEVLTNATDHVTRDPTVTTIKIDYDKKTGEISIWNNGSGVPVVLHKEHNLYVPELIFGHLLSGSNYDDNQQRTGAGLNGLGVKLTSIFSKSFTIETIDSDNKKKFIQEYTENMSNKTEPKITSNSSKSYTKVTFIPDYKRFNMKGLEDDTILLINKRVYDCMACTNKNVNIYLNGEKLKGKSFSDYTKYFFDEDKYKVFYESDVQKIKGTEFIWEYAIIPHSHFEQISFVNGNATVQGGKHVDYILYQIVNRLKEMLETKKKLKDVKPSFIKDRLFLFLRTTIVNPSFNSQTKEMLTTPSKDFGCKVEVSDKFIEKIWKSSIIEDIVEFCKVKESLELSKNTDGKKKNRIFVPKLEDALWAGTAKSDQCTLILTEGLSAMTFAMWGRSVVGPEKYGIFPMKGKVLNIRDATMSQLMNNEEINNLKQIIGLQNNKEYKNTSELRYGKLLILTDADTDGSHIKGLIVNLFHCWWPSLIKLDFIQTLRTPIIKAIKGQKVIEFYTEQDYNKWKENNGSTKGYQIRYFKGLGTSKKEDAKDTFKRYEELKVDYYYKDKGCDEAILLAFEKDKNIKSSKTDITSDDSNTEVKILKCSDKRKRWLGQYDKESYIDVKENKISYQDLINKELIHFSIYDNMRSIPSICDGLKPSQRKILYYMLNKNITKSIKVAQLSGYVSAETGYHHGEMSLQQAIIGMAQNFVGSNNINLLYPDGNFGSRLNGGKDAASPRYIFTRLDDVSLKIFNENDSTLLKYLSDDGTPIEPEWYLPVIPMVLVNGCEGIGTGYSTFIPPYNPKDIISNLLRVLDGDGPLKMIPYFRGFNGIVEEVKDVEGSYLTRGKWERLSDNQIKITELPVGMWVTVYKEFLESLIVDNSSKKKDSANTKKRPNKIVLKDVKNKTKDENDDICFIVEFKSSEDLNSLIKTGTLEKELKLIKTFSTNNMYLFGEDLILSKYGDPNDILLDFYDIRLDYYVARKEYMTKKLENELALLKAKVRFIEEYITGKLDINRKSREYINELLEKGGYPKFGYENSEVKSYDYLVRMQIVSLTGEKIDELNKQRDEKQRQLNNIKSKTEKDLWRQDLQDILKMI